MMLLLPAYETACLGPQAFPCLCQSCSFDDSSSTVLDTLGFSLVFGQSVSKSNPALIESSMSYLMELMKIASI